MKSGFICPKFSDTEHMIYPKLALNGSVDIRRQYTTFRDVYTRGILFTLFQWLRKSVSSLKEKT